MPGLAVGGTAEGLSAKNAWMRAPAVPGRHGAGYVTLHNKGAQPAQLVGASSPEVKRIELHRSEMKDGVMTMAEQDAIHIPAKGTAKLEPGSYHLMLIKPTESVKAGDTVQLTLSFRSGAQITLEAQVVGPGRTPDMAKDD